MAWRRCPALSSIMVAARAYLRKTGTRLLKMTRKKRKKKRKKKKLRRRNPRRRNWRGRKWI